MTRDTMSRARASLRRGAPGASRARTFFRLAYSPKHHREAKFAELLAGKQAQRQFRTRATIMVATGAAGEGIDWNPNRVEQGMGRGHRYGRYGDVRVYHLVGQNTRKRLVLQKVLAKLDVGRAQMGRARVYDVIDEWPEGVPLARLVASAIALNDESAGKREIGADLSRASNERTGRLMATRKRTSPFANRRALS